MATTKDYHLFVVTCYKNEVKQTVRVKAPDKRRAKHMAKRKLGNDISIVAALRWQEHMKRVRS